MRSHFTAVLVILVVLLVHSFVNLSLCFRHVRLQHQVTILVNKVQQSIQCQIQSFLLTDQGHPKIRNGKHCCQQVSNLNDYDGPVTPKPPTQRYS